MNKYSFLKKNILLLFISVLIFGCNTDTFELEKLSSQTGLMPEVQFPIAQMELGIKSFLDSLNLEVDDERDAYGTIYLKEYIDDIGAIELSDVFDLNEFATEFSTTYNLEPITLDDASIFSGALSFSQISTATDGASLSSIPAIPVETIAIGTTRFMPSAYGEATLQSGVLVCGFQNRFPIPITITVRLEDGTGNTLVNSSPKQLAVDESAEVVIDLANVSLPNNISIVTDIASVGTTSPVTIDYSMQELFIDVAHRDAVLSKIAIVSPITLAFSFDQDVGFDAPDGELLSQLNLETATFNLEVKHNFNASSELSVKSPDIQVAGNSFERTYNMSASPNAQNFDWDMDAVEIQFSQNGTESLFKLQYDLNLNLQAGAVIETNKSIELSGGFSALELAAVFGDFGMKSVSFNDTVEITEDVSDYIDKIKWFEPKVDLLINSTLGVPAKYTVEANAVRKDGSSFNFQTPNFQPIISAPVQLQDTAFTRITYDSSNSDIAGLLSFLPDDYVSTDLMFTLNPAGAPSTPNFLHKDSKIWVDAEVETPVHFSINDLAIRDTVRFEPPLKGEDDLDRILAASLRMHFTSDIPLHTAIKTTLIDTLSNEILAIFDAFEMNAAAVDANGEVTNPATFTSELAFSNDEIHSLKRGNGLAFEIQVNSADNQDRGVKISSKAKIKLSAAAKLKVQIDD